MKKIKSIIAAVTITFCLVFSCRIVMIPTPLAMSEQVALVLMLVEFSFYKSKQLEVDNEKK